TTNPTTRSPRRWPPPKLLPAEKLVGVETAAEWSRAAVSGEWVALVEGAVRSVSPGPDGERVGVVGQDRPFSPDLLALVAFEAAAVQPVAAFGVAGAAP